MGINTVIKIAVFDENRYFTAGWQYVLTQHFKTYGQRTLLLDVKQAQDQDVDLVFCFFPLGLKSCFCHLFNGQIVGRKTLCFTLRTPEERHKRTVGTRCSLEAGVIYHDMSLASALSQVSSRLGMQYNTPYHKTCDKVGNQLISGVACLTVRESEVLYLMMEAKRGCQIARELKLSEKTVSCHKMKIMRKLGFNRDIDFYKWMAVLFKLTY